MTRRAHARFVQALVSEVKAKVTEVTQVPAQLQRLIFRGRVLRDDSRIREHCIEDGNCLHLVHSTPPQEHRQAPPHAPELPEHVPGGVANAGAVRAVPSRHSLLRYCAESLWRAQHALSDCELTRPGRRT